MNTSLEKRNLNVFPARQWEPWQKIQFVLLCKTLRSDPQTTIEFKIVFIPVLLCNMFMLEGLFWEQKVFGNNVSKPKHKNK